MDGRQHLSVQAAATRLGLSEFGLRKAIDRGELRPVPGTLPLKLDPADIERLITTRRTAAIRRLGARGVDLVQLAKDTRAFLRPPIGAPSSGGVSKVGQDVVAVFGMPALNAAAIADPGVCGWCAATVAARMLGTEPPAYSEAYAALLGPPCVKDTALVANAMARLDARVHGASVGLSEARTAPAAPPRPATAPKAAVRPVERPARPAAPAVLAAALAAAGVPRATRYAGRLRCGHPVGGQCGCPRTVTASAKQPRVQLHGCGCECELHQEGRR